jgi:hypothetical protein
VLPTTINDLLPCLKIPTASPATTGANPAKAETTTTLIATATATGTVTETATVRGKAKEASAAKVEAVAKTAAKGATEIVNLSHSH